MHDYPPDPWTPLKLGDLCIVWSPAAEVGGLSMADMTTANAYTVGNFLLWASNHRVTAEWVVRREAVHIRARELGFEYVHRKLFNAGRVFSGERRSSAPSSFRSCAASSSAPPSASAAATPTAARSGGVSPARMASKIAWLIGWRSTAQRATAPATPPPQLLDQAAPLSARTPCEEQTPPPPSSPPPPSEHKLYDMPTTPPLVPNHQPCSQTDEPPTPPTTQQPPPPHRQPQRDEQRQKQQRQKQQQQQQREVVYPSQQQLVSTGQDDIATPPPMVATGTLLSTGDDIVTPHANLTPAAGGSQPAVWPAADGPHATRNETALQRARLHNNPNPPGVPARFALDVRASLLRLSSRMPFSWTKSSSGASLVPHTVAHNHGAARGESDTTSIWADSSKSGSIWAETPSASMSASVSASPVSSVKTAHSSVLDGEPWQMPRRLGKSRGKSGGGGKSGGSVGAQAHLGGRLAHDPHSPREVGAFVPLSALPEPSS